MQPGLPLKHRTGTALKKLVHSFKFVQHYTCNIRIHFMHVACFVYMEISMTM